MKNFVFALFVAVGFCSCADMEAKKRVGPTTESTNIPWNAPIAGQGGGQFGMLPQNQNRR